MVHDDGNLHNLDTCSVVVVAYCCGMCFGDGVGVVGQVVDGGGCGGGLVYLAQIRCKINVRYKNIKTQREIKKEKSTRPYNNRLHHKRAY